VPSADPPQRLFFCTGLPKSGTTYLQGLLNAHPQIACAAEQDLSRLAELLGEAASQYNRRAVTLDLRTGGSGRPAFEAATLSELVRAAMLAILRAGAGGKAILGAKDNRLLLRLDACGALFPEARFLCILRNPLDRAVSAWHHNLRLAEREKDARHSELVLRHGSLDAWALHLCRLHRADLASFQAATLPRARRLVVRYEDLVADPRPQVERLLAYLGADAAPATVAAMLERSSLDAMRSSAVDSGFFRAAAIDGGAREISGAVRREAAERFAADFALLGYRITAGGLTLLPFELG
jgi:hypothetical protein